MMNKMMRTLMITIAAASLAAVSLAASAGANEIFEEIPAAEVQKEAAFAEEQDEIIFENIFEDVPAFEEEIVCNADPAVVIFESVFEEVSPVTEEAASYSVSTYRIAVANIDLKIKPQPNTESAAIGSVKKGQQVEVLEDLYENDGRVRWSKIRLNGVVGYVSGWYDNLITVSAANQTPVVQPQTIVYNVNVLNRTMYVNNPLGLNVFTEPNSASAIFANLSNNTAVFVNGVVLANGANTGFAQVAVNGRIGYVVNHLTDQPVVTLDNTQKNYRVVVSAGALALRSRAENTTASQIGFLPNGSTVRETGNRKGDFVWVTVTDGPASSYGSSMTGYSGYVNASCLRAM